MTTKFFIRTLTFFTCTIFNLLADTPANCTYNDAYGLWQINITKCLDNCNELIKNNHAMEIRTLFPNLAQDNFGNIGKWTLIYNQGFEVFIANRKWLFMFAYDKITQQSLCNESMPGYSYNTLGKEKWLFKAYKLSQTIVSRIHKNYINSTSYSSYKEISDAINSDSTTNWKATVYPYLLYPNQKTLLNMKGGKKSRIINRATATTISHELKQLLTDLPTEFDWRFPKDGSPNHVTPVRNQGSCGSCYAFASAGALEARISIMTNGSFRPILSPQDIVDCSIYSEGCDGGFPYLIAGKYSEEFGMVNEKDAPYTGKENRCSTPKNAPRLFSTNYEYIGGYYGACNEYLMLLELVNKGPFPVGFEVYDDFMTYKSGVYKHSNKHLNKFEPFELTNHAVVIVGYGVDNNTNEPYWIVKNSWGTSWGEDGYFRILRGSDECGIESLAVSIEAVL